MSRKRREKSETHKAGKRFDKYVLDFYKKVQLIKDFDEIAGITKDHSTAWGLWAKNYNSDKIKSMQIAPDGFYNYIRYYGKRDLKNLRLSRATRREVAKQFRKGLRIKWFNRLSDFFGTLAHRLRSI